MQTLNIGGEPVMEFYVSGSNTHLVEGGLVGCVSFTVLDDMCVPIRDVPDIGLAGYPATF